MSKENSKICRLCLKRIMHSAFSLTEKNKEQIWDILHLKLNVDVTLQPVMCDECEANLQRGCNFKITSLNVDSVILPYDYNEELGTVTLRGNVKLNRIVQGKWCPFCGEANTNGCFIYLQETKDNVFVMDIVQKYFSELNLNTIERQICCLACFDTLGILSTFIRKCLNAEVRIKTFMAEKGTDDKGKVELEDVLHSEFKSKASEIGCTNREVENPESDPNDPVVNVGSEVLIKIKDECHWNIHDSEGNIESEEIEIKSEETSCDRIQTHPAKQVTLSCEICSYKTTYKHCLSRHMLRHKSASEVPLYQCPLCSFKTKYQSGATRHMLTHKSDSEIKIYKCLECSFESKHKNSFIRHLLVHKNPADICRVKCEYCPYAAQSKSRLKQHTLTHKKPSEITMYKCDTCSYQCKRSDNLKQHMLIHKKNSEVVTYKCDSCSYEAKLKGSLKKHLEVHMSRRLRRGKQLRCHMCKYDAKQKRDFKKHMRTHRVFL